jgi:hypothetical protein
VTSADECTKEVKEMVEKTLKCAGMVAIAGATGDWNQKVIDACKDAVLAFVKGVCEKRSIEDYFREYGYKW